MPVGGGQRALEIVGKRLGVAPSHPPEGDPGEFVLEFEWSGRPAGVVTDGAKYFVAVSMPVRIAAFIGTWDLGRRAHFSMVNGIRVYAYPGRALPTAWLDSDQGEAFLSALAPWSDVSVSFSEDGVSAEMPPLDSPEHDAERVFAFLGALGQLEPFAIDVAVSPAREREAGSPRSAATTNSRDKRLTRLIDVYRPLLLSDDLKREVALQQASVAVLAGIVAKVSPLLVAIDAELDRFKRPPEMPMQRDDADRETDLTSLAQLAIEAAAELRSRG